MSLFSKQPTKRKPKVNKCPYCGAILTLSSTVCPDCNAEVSVSNTSEVVEEFAAQINKAEKALDRSSVINVVKNFPLLPAKGEVFTQKSIDNVGSSI